MEKDNLYLLIQSMTGGEKRLLKKYLNLRSKSPEKHLQLFQALDKPPPSTKEEYESNFPDFKRRKQELTNHILFSLRIGRMSETSLQARLEAELAHFHIYNDRGMPALAAKALHKARKLAQKLEKWNLLLEINYHERRITMAQEKQKLAKKLDQLKSECRATIDLIQEEDVFQSAYEQMLVHHRKTSDQPTLNRAVARILSAKSFQEAKPNTSFHAANLHLSTLSLGAVVRNDRQAQLKYKADLIQLWESHPDWIKEAPRRFLIILANYGVGLYTAGKWEEIEGVLQKLRAIPLRTAAERKEAFQNEAYLEQIWLINTGKFQAARKRVDWVLDGLKKYRGKINTARKHAMLYHILFLYFILGEHENARKTAARLIQERRFKIREEVQRFARIVEVITYFELEDDISGLPEEVQTVRMFLRNRGEETPFFRKFLNSLGKFHGFSFHHKGHIASTHNMDRSDLVKFASLAEGDGDLGTLELRAWLLAKLEGRSVAETIWELMQAPATN